MDGRMVGYSDTRYTVIQLDMILSLTYFCDLDTALYNGLRPPSAYAAVVRLPTTATFLVVYATTNVRIYFAGLGLITLNARL